jgi:cytochrome c peroxidase
VATYDVNGDIDESGPFFQSLGTNGRSCGSCHRADEAMSLRSAGVRQIYAQTHGRDPLFQAVDGANCPTDDAEGVVAQPVA